VVNFWSEANLNGEAPAVVSSTSLGKSRSRE
jgi:hypothetical protein